MVKRSIVCMGAGRFTLKVAQLALDNGAWVAVWDPDQEKLERLPNSVEVCCTCMRDRGQLNQLVGESGEALVFVAALADSDETNLVTCHLVSQLGAPFTCGVLLDGQYRFFTQQFGMTHALFPNQLMVNQLIPAILMPGAMPYGSFALGAIQMRTFCIPDTWKKGELALAELKLPRGICIGCVRRLQEGLDLAKEASYRFIIPHGEDVLLVGDEVVCFGETAALMQLPSFFGLKTEKPKEVVVAGEKGGEGLGGVEKELIRFLSLHKISVCYVQQDERLGASIAKEFPECKIVAQSVEQWSRKKLESSKHPTFFVACGRDFASNLEQGLFAKEAGYSVFITEAGTMREKNQAKQLGLEALSSSEDLVAENIVALLLSEPRVNYWHLYGNAILLMELVVSARCHAVGLSLAVFFSSVIKVALILAVEHRGCIFTPSGDTVLFPGDRILLITESAQRDSVLALFV